MKRDTLLIHGGEPSPRIAGSAVPPIFQSTVYAMEGTPAYDDIIYPRLNNLPNHEVLAKKLALLEGAEAGLVTASGMAAITTTLLTLLAGGGHLLLQSRVYGGTDSFVREDLAGLGIAVDFIEELDPDDWKRKLRSNTRVIYTEAIGNPLLQVPDHRQVVAFAREHGLTSVVDNTFASPINFRPIEHGYDLSVHSATKYLNGHSDLCAGAVAGSKTLVDRIRHRLNHLGGTLDPHACFLLHRGMKTLSLRVTRQNESALWLAQRLEADDRIKSVLYPGLPSHPQHGKAREFFSGFGGMLSFEVAGDAAAFLRHLELPIVGPSLGGVESLAVRPATSSHRGMPPEERRRLGLTDSLVRYSVGIEAPEDLLADIEQALAAS